MRIYKGEAMKRFGLTGNQLKLLAVILMTIDHIGYEILPQYRILRIIGRLAFPIFAFMIAEGCRYTKNKKIYLLTLAVEAAILQIVYSLLLNRLYMNILVTFTFSVILIYILIFAEERNNLLGFIISGAALLTVIVITYVIPDRVSFYGLQFDYGIFGILMPVVIYLAKGKWEKLFAALLMLCILSIGYGGIQWYCLLAVPLLAMYNGKRGNAKMKYFFYGYYPVHLLIIHFIACAL